jgi:hypothetical protein
MLLNNELGKYLHIRREIGMRKGQWFDFDICVGQMKKDGVTWSKG